MPSEIFYSPLAIQDLEDIERYIAEELLNPKAARNTVNAILDRIDLLALFPESGTPLDSVCSIRGPYRYVTSGSYLAFYHLAGGVYVDRVLYKRRDYIRVLFGSEASLN